MERLRPEDPETVGPWTVVGRLGSGGMGEVYIGKQGTDLVAIKVLHRWLATDIAFKNRFAREIESIAKLESPNIAKYINSDLSGDIGWLAIEYVDGPSLKEEVEVNGPLDDKNWNSLAKGLLSALKEMQQQNVVHRDIKPSNIILSKSGPKLVDFGLSQQVDSTSLTVTGMIAGSPAWISPEAINSEKLTIESDLFSVGSVLAYAKEGRNVWGDGLTAVVFNNIVTRNYKVSKLNSIQKALIEELFSKDLKIRIKAMNTFLTRTELDLPKNSQNLDLDKTEILERKNSKKSEATKVIVSPEKSRPEAKQDFVLNESHQKTSENNIALSKKSILKSWQLIGSGILMALIVASQSLGIQGDVSKNSTAIDSFSPPASPTPSAQPTVQPVSPTPTKSPTPNASKSINPTKSPTPKVTATPQPTPTSRWWTDDMVLWNENIAYKFSHWDGGCNQWGTCFAGYGLEVLLKEPCSKMSAEILDDSGKIYVMYRTQYSPTGQRLGFDTGASDETHETSGKLTKLECIP